jgi:beta-glucanase (GH16 family)
MIWAALVATAAVSSLAVTPPNEFVDRFERLDVTRWTVSDGWSNGPWYLNDWRRSQMAPGRSGLTVTIDKNPLSKNGYSSGELQSKRLYQYGYYEIRMKSASGAGVVTGFFTYTGAPRGKPWNEIDVEILGKNTRAVQLTYHVPNGQKATTLDLPFDSALEAHTYGFEWQPTHIRWYIDGRLVHEETGAGLALPSEPGQVMFDVWNSNVNPPWMGVFTWPGHPITSQVSCIAVAVRFAGRTLC